MNKIENRSHVVAKLIEETIVKVFTLSAIEIISHFNDLQSTLLKQDLSNFEKLEIERRITESIISLLSEKNFSKEFEEIWKRMEFLEYSDTEREASMVFYRASFLIKNRIDKNLAEEAVNRLGGLIHSFQEKKLQHLADHFNQVHKRLQNDIACFY